MASSNDAKTPVQHDCRARINGRIYDPQINYYIGPAPQPPVVLECECGEPLTSEEYCSGCGESYAGYDFDGVEL